MRILHVIHRYPPAIGGGELWCAGLARWQAAQGHAVRVLTLRAVGDDELWGERLWGPDLADADPPAPGPVAVGAYDHQDGVDIHRCDAAGPIYAVSRLLARAGLEALSWGHGAEFHGCLVREARRADVVHAYWLSGPHALAAWVGARLTRRPFVITPFFHVGFAPQESRASRALLRRAQRVIALTAAEAEALRGRGVHGDRIAVAGHAIETPVIDPEARTRVRQALRVPAEAPLLCYVGRKAPNKGIDVLLAALARLRHRPAPQLVLAGPDTDWYRALRARGPSRGLIDLPFVPEATKMDLLAAADVLVLPSKLESFGTVFLEAWAAGTPVVGADIHAVREVVGDAGLLFRPDDVGDLAVRLDELLGAPALARTLAERGRARVAEHSWDRLGATVMAAYEAVVPRGRGAAPVARPAAGLT